MSSSETKPEMDGEASSQRETSVTEPFAASEDPAAATDRAGGEGLQFLTDVMRGAHSLCIGRGRSEFRLDRIFDEPVELHQAALEHSRDGRDVWFGVNPVRSDLPPGSRGRADDVVDVGVLFADIDWHDPTAHVNGNLPDEQTTRRLLRTFQHQPTGVVCSGHGLQAYWLLRDPIEPEEAKALSTLLIDRLKGHGLAAEAGDIARVLRVPETVNLKDPDHPVVVTLEMWKAGDRYVPEYLERHLKRLPTAKRPKKSASPVEGHHKVEGLADPRSGDAASGSTRSEVERNKVDQALSAALKALRVEGRHPVMVEYQGKLVAYRRMGYPGAAEALTTLKDAYSESKRFDYPEHEVQADWERALRGAEEWADREDVSPLPPTFPLEWNDALVAQAFADHIRDQFLWVSAWGWLRWDGRRWAPDDREAIFEEARQWVVDLGVAAMRLPGDTSDLLKSVVRYKHKGKIEGFVTVARRLEGVAATPDEFDCHPHLLNVDNGVVDLRSGELRAHDPALRLTKIAGGCYDSAARHDDVDHMFDAVEPGVRPWLQRFFGYASTGLVDEDVVVILDGGGSNGKTTLLEAVSGALGDYAKPASARLIMKSSHEEHPTLEADLFGRRLVTIEETEEGGAIRSERLKMLSGGSTITARRMRRDYFSFSPTHTLVVATNHRPSVNSTEHALWRRLRLVPFPYTYVDADNASPGERIKDRALRQRLISGGDQRRAVLAWLIAGAVGWYRDGLGSCASVDQATDRWRLEEDVIARFCIDRLVPDDGARIRGSDLYTEYRMFCDAEGRSARSNKNFVAAFLGHEWIKDSVRRTNPQNRAAYRGVRLRRPEDPDDVWA
jgi:putative DNA primase/helicase